MALPQAPGDSLLTSFHPPGAAGGIAGGIAGGESSEVDPQSAFTTKQTAASINGIHTDIVVQIFSDRIFVLVAQMAKVGNLLYATQEDNSRGGKEYNVNVLMGRRDDPLLVVYARRLIEKMSSIVDLPLLLAITLQDGGRDTQSFQDIIKIVLRLLEL